MAYGALTRQGGLRCDVLVVGGGLGGIAAALTAARLDRSVVLTEESVWLGGQLTTQAVPPDEHPWIEHTGASRSYQRLRRLIRDHYRQRPDLTARAQRDETLNPGGCWVSAIGCEPAVAVGAIEQLLAPYVASRRLQILRKHSPVMAGTVHDEVRTVAFVNQVSGDRMEIESQYVLDATEEGDLLALADCEHVVGWEGHEHTAEPHASTDGPRPLDQQAFTWCFALEHRPGEDHTIDRPTAYEFWKNYQAPFWPGPQLGWDTQDPLTGEQLSRPLFGEPGEKDLWTFRRIVDARLYDDPSLHDVTVVNWPQVDYWLGPLIGQPDDLRAEHLRQSRLLGLSFVHWLQTEAPRADGGTGYPGMRLAPKILGSDDGFALRPYVRESRRIRARFTVTEHHVGADARPGADGAADFHDTVGVGSYRIDLHPSSGGDGYIDVASWPFQIPLGALVPVRLRNLLPAAKNLGVTHVTGGCYRLHPVEWSVGEAAGALAAYCLDGETEPHAVHSVPAHLEAFQRQLQDLGVQLHWPEHIRRTRR